MRSAESQAGLWGRGLIGRDGRVNERDRGHHDERRIGGQGAIYEESSRMGTQPIVLVPGTGKLPAIRSGDAGGQVQHRLSVADCLPDSFRIEEVEFGR